MERGAGRALAYVGVGAYAFAAILWIVFAYTRDSSLEADAPRLLDAVHAWWAGDGLLLLCAAGAALLAMAGVGRPLLLWRVAGTFVALHLVTYHAFNDLIWRALAPWPGLPENTMVASAWIRICGQAALVAAPWLAGRAWRTTGLILVVAAIARLTAHLLFWSEQAPEAAAVFQECVTMAALFTVGIIALTGMPTAGRHASILLGCLILASALAFLPQALDGGSDAPGVASFVFEALAGFVLLAAWALPHLQRMATPHPEPA